VVLGGGGNRPTRAPSVGGLPYPMTRSTSSRAITSPTCVRRRELVPPLAMARPRGLVAAVLDAVSHVLGGRSVAQVRQAIVEAVPVQVPRDHACGPRTDKRQQEKSVDRLPMWFCVTTRTALRERDAQVTLFVGGRSEQANGEPFMGPDTSLVADLVVREAGNGCPRFGTHAASPAMFRCLRFRGASRFELI
jgi:hypothetical protein